MYKRKLKLNSLYGQMVSAAEKPLTAFGVSANKKATKAMQVCAVQVRKTSCARCLHYAECVKNDGNPVSMLGRLIYELNENTLREISNELARYCINGLTIKAFAPNIDELKEGAYAVIRAYSVRGKKRLIFRLNIQGGEDYETLRTLVFNAYIRAKGKNKNGKSKR